MNEGLDLGVVGSFVAFLLMFVAIGAYSATRASKTDSDYLLADRSISPWMTALSAVATNNSGFMFIGLIGATYTSGISAMWLMVGWVGGDQLTWYFVHRRLREASEKMKVNTIPSFLASDGTTVSRSIAVVGGLIVVIFLGTYAAAQLNAGSKALHVLFGWPYSTGAILGAVVIVIYCFSGGIRASIWTDSVQSVVMLFAMLLLMVTALMATGGFGPLWQKLAEIDPKLVTLIPQDLELGFTLYLLGWFGAGLGVIGQPHIMIRAMAIRSPEDVAKARRIYFVWYWAFAAACIGVGLACRVLLTETSGVAFDAELALPRLAAQLLPSVFIGLILAGLFAATMSTADSQVLSCSASLTQDVLPRNKNAYLIAKVGTVGVTTVALLIALFGSDNVFSLVTLAWSMLASGLGPLMLIRVLGRPVSRESGVLMMLGGVGGVLLWRFGLGLSGAVYDVLPGMVTGLVVYFVVQSTVSKRN